MEIDLQVPAAATMQDAASLRQHCLDALPGDGPINVDISAVIDADLSFVQLIQSLRASALEAGRPVRLCAPAPAPVVALLERAGFLAAATPQDLEFWFHGETAQ